ncbi:hypothetical protein [Bradyrhizobium viridifuturi]|uniref:hypothetical protein n=1 Tax=Bradyrhizobium viridifuturi TaxID=1654716 RepID=UPI00067EB784|nr:hypothetical protein [Bradyrhizobium viridifuturi]
MHGQIKGRQNRKRQSAVTSGRKLFLKTEGLDMRTSYALRFRDVLQIHTDELGPTASEAELAIVRRAATLIVQLEQMEAKFAVEDASPTALESYQRLANSMRRLLESVGLKRRPRDVTPSLHEYLASKSKPRREVLTIDHEDDD